MHWSNVLRGFLIGTSDLVPGVSGGTIAVMLGVYDELLAALSGLFSREWRRHIGFLLPLGLGMAAALLTLSRGMSWLLQYHYGPTQFFFLGLIIGIVPDLLQRADAKDRFKPVHIGALLAAAALVASLAFVNPQDGPQTTTVIQLTRQTAIVLFGAGWLASVAMLLPGISGSFVLLVLGVYPTAIYALSSLDIGLIATIGAGVAVGFFASSKAIRYLLAHFRDVTFAIIIGLIVGSVVVVWPGLPSASAADFITCGLTFAAGWGATKLFGKKESV